MNPINPHFLLVQMLFALTIQEIARKFAALCAQVCPQTLPRRTWSESWSVVSHLALTTVLVITSWVGWSFAVPNTLSDQKFRALVTSGIFSSYFVLLLVDMAIVTCYYIIANGSGLPARAKKPIVHSARNEAIGVAAVFLLYAVWDWLYLMTYDRAPGWESIIVFVLALFPCLVAILRDPREQRAVVALDVALVSLILGFRAAKKEMWWLTVMLGVLFVACLVAAWFPERWLKPANKNPATGDAEPQVPPPAST